MASIFSTKTGLRSVYVSKAFGSLIGTNATTAVLFETAAKPYRLAYFDNTTNKDLTILVCHPDIDSTVVANRILWVEIPSNRVINFGEMQMPNLELDPGTQIFVFSTDGVAPTSGKLSALFWG